MEFGCRLMYAGVALIVAFALSAAQRPRVQPRPSRDSAQNAGLPRTREDLFKRIAVALDRGDTVALARLIVTPPNQALLEGILARNALRSPGYRDFRCPDVSGPFSGGRATGGCSLYLSSETEVEIRPLTVVESSGVFRVLTLDVDTPSSSASTSRDTVVVHESRPSWTFFLAFCAAAVASLGFAVVYFQARQLKDAIEQLPSKLVSPILQELRRPPEGDKSRQASVDPGRHSSKALNQAEGGPAGKPAATAPQQGALAPSVAVTPPPSPDEQIIALVQRLRRSDASASEELNRRGHVWVASSGSGLVSDEGGRILAIADASTGAYFAAPSPDIKYSTVVHREQLLSAVFDVTNESSLTAGGANWVLERPARLSRIGNQWSIELRGRLRLESTA